MEETAIKTRSAAEAEADATIARRLETMLRAAREDETKLLRILEMRLLKRRATRPPHTS